MTRTILILIALTSAAPAAVWLPVIDSTGNAYYLASDPSETPVSFADALVAVNAMDLQAGYPAAYGASTYRNPAALYFLPTDWELYMGWFEDDLPVGQAEWREDSWATGDLASYRVGMRAVTSPHEGDANNDGLVDVVDLGILAQNYGSECGMWWSAGDFNLDGAVDVVDLGILAKNYDWTTAAVVPEPCMLTLMCFPILACRHLGRSASLGNPAGQGNLGRHPTRGVLV